MFRARRSQTMASQAPHCKRGPLVQLKSTSDSERLNLRKAWSKEEGSNMSEHPLSGEGCSCKSI
eukprot:362044-Alexandrium_andersonii.AAC.1